MSEESIKYPHASTLTKVLQPAPGPATPASFSKLITYRNAGNGGSLYPTFPRVMPLLKFASPSGRNPAQKGLTELVASSVSWPSRRPLRWLLVFQGRFSWRFSNNTRPNHKPPFVCPNTQHKPQPPHPTNRHGFYEQFFFASPPGQILPCITI